MKHLYDVLKLPSPDHFDLVDANDRGLGDQVWRFGWLLVVHDVSDVVDVGPRSELCDAVAPGGERPDFIVPES